MLALIAPVAPSISHTHAISPLMAALPSDTPLLSAPVKIKSAPKSPFRAVIPLLTLAFRPLVVRLLTQSAESKPLSHCPAETVPIEPLLAVIVASIIVPATVNLSRATPLASAPVKVTSASKSPDTPDLESPLTDMLETHGATSEPPSHSVAVKLFRYEPRTMSVSGCNTPVVIVTPLVAPRPGNRISAPFLTSCN